jgi:serine/threonine protein phosphatase PrpC
MNSNIKDGPGIVLDSNDDECSNHNSSNMNKNFRQRRLSYTFHKVHSFDEEDDKEEPGTQKEEKKKNINKDSESTFPSDDDDDDDLTTIKRSQDDMKYGHLSKSKSSSSSSPEPKRVKVETKVLHANFPPQPECPERKASTIYMHPPRENTNDECHILQEKDSSDNETENHTHDWKKRHQFSHNHPCHILPFPRDIVGTYSCHGMEPIYEDEYDDHVEKLVDDENAVSIAKINQDRGGIAFPFASCKKTALFGAYDGHGEGGELVAQYCLHQIPLRLEQHEAFQRGDFETAFKDVFLEVDKNLDNQIEIEPMYSGCTAVVALVQGDDIFFANAGDSRAVLAYHDSNTKDHGHLALDLTVDQNPDSPGEQERIEKMGGFVSPPPEEGLSARVWLDAGFTQIGLAMARSLGDHAVKPVGVIAEPVVSHHKLREEDDFLIIATDGVWEFLSSQEAVDIVSSEINQGASYACQRLIEAAASKWHEHEGDYRDDITAIVVRLRELWK